MCLDLVHPSLLCTPTPGFQGQLFMEVSEPNTSTHTLDNSRFTDISCIIFHVKTHHKGMAVFLKEEKKRLHKNKINFKAVLKDIYLYCTYAHLCIRDYINLVRPVYIRCKPKCN